MPFISHEFKSITFSGTMGFSPGGKKEECVFFYPKGMLSLIFNYCRLFVSGPKVSNVHTMFGFISNKVNTLISVCVCAYLQDSVNSNQAAEICCNLTWYV